MGKSVSYRECPKCGEDGIKVEIGEITDEGVAVTVSRCFNVLCNHRPTKDETDKILYPNRKCKKA